MPHSLPSTPLRFVLLAVMAGAAALIANGLASPARRLAWRGPRTLEVAVVRPPAPVPLPPAPGEPATAAPPAPVFAPAKPQRPAAGPDPRPAVTSAMPRPPEAPAASPIREIDGREAWEAFQAGAAFLDARRSADYAEGHIARAWCAPIWESDLEDRLLGFKAQRRPGPEDPIVIYCSGGECRDSHLLAARLLNEGYNRLLIYRDGYPGWVAAGHPVEKGQP